VDAVKNVGEFVLAHVIMIGDLLAWTEVAMASEFPSRFLRCLQRGVRCLARLIGPRSSLSCSASRLGRIAKLTVLGSTTYCFPDQPLAHRKNCEWLDEDAKMTVEYWATTVAFLIRDVVFATGFGLSYDVTTSKCFHQVPTELLRLLH
jgi:hypothetical protein